MDSSRTEDADATPDEPGTEPPLRGTLLGVIGLGIILVGSWFGAFLLYVHRSSGA